MALNLDPDNVEAQRAIKNMKQCAIMKERASDVFKKEEYKEADQLFDQCLQIDPLNLNYCSIIYLNKSIALGKLKQHEASMSCLNQSLKMNPRYAKALVKRGEVHQELGDHEEAVRDFAKAAEIDQSGFGVQGKLKAA